MKKKKKYSYRKEVIEGSDHKNIRDIRPTFLEI